MLRVWLAQAKNQHAATVNFPYLLMPNPRQQPPFPLSGIQYANLGQQRHPINLPDNVQVADEAAVNRLLLDYVNRNVNNRQNQFVNTHQRNEESKQIFFFVDCKLLISQINVIILACGRKM